jgi:hypothetical protein
LPSTGWHMPPGNIRRVAPIGLGASVVGVALGNGYVVDGDLGGGARLVQGEPIEA